MKTEKEIKEKMVKLKSTDTEKELKTLKDLNIIKGKALGGEVGVDELKQEAIKWVKALQHKIDNYKASEYTIDWQKQIWVEQQNILKNFFNITEVLNENKNRKRKRT